jgi:hypothetical protein
MVGGVGMGVIVILLEHRQRITPETAQFVKAVGLVGSHQEPGHQQDGMRNTVSKLRQTTEFLLKVIISNSKPSKEPEKAD